MKRLISSILKVFNYKIVKISKSHSSTGSMEDLLQLLKKNGMKCIQILDVGANKGEWSRLAKNVYPSSHFHLIEPQVELKESLERFCSEFENCSYTLAGAGSKKETRLLTIWEDLLGSSFLPSASDKLKEAGKQREISITTIDYLIESKTISMPTLIKLDIQGFELEALKGATRTFGETEVFIIETSLYSFDDTPNAPLIHEIISFMTEHGYYIYDFPGFLRRPFDQSLGQCDICFVKSHGILRKSNKWK